MDVQGAVEGSTAVASADDNGDARRDGQKKLILGPNDTFEGKLTYDGHVQIGGRADGEFRVSGNVDITSGGAVRALIEGANVSVRGSVEGVVTARDKLTLGRNAKLNGDITVRRLQIDEGATFNGRVQMGEGDSQAPGA